MSRPILFDVTHLASRCQVRPHTGIDRVDLSFAKALAATKSIPILGLHGNVLWPHLLPRRAIYDLIQRAEAPTPAPNPDYKTKQLISDWLAGTAPAYGNRRSSLPSYSVDSSLSHRVQQHFKLMVPNPVRSSLPEASIYLNVAPFGTPGPIYFRWLRRRPDIKAVFFVHDLLPLDYPELFPSEWYRFHRQMISAMMERASGVIVASDAVRERVQRELSAHGASHVKVHVAHLPPGPTFRERSLGDPVLQAHPYFVMCGTIEPRKNHRLVLEVWRQFRREHSSSTPRLILIGKRGWMSDQTFAMLDNEVSLSSVILEASAVPDSVQHWLLSNACAALCPSRAEGYGLPLVEALSVGTPVVASAIPVFREVSQGFASFCHPGDLEHWKRTISSLSDRSACTWAAAEVRTRQFRPPTMEGYFTSVMQFLEAL